MTLKKWTQGDIITEISANNKSIRKGTTSDLNAIPIGSREDGDITYNETLQNPQIQIDATNDQRGNVKILLAADSTEVSVTGTTATEKKNMDFVKNPNAFSGNIITIVAEIKTSNAGSTAHLRVREDGGGTDRLDLTTTSTSYVVVTGTIDIRAVGGSPALAFGRHTLEFFLDDGSGDTIDNRILEVYGI